MTWRRLSWKLIAPAAAYGVVLVTLTPAHVPSGHEPGILGHLLPGSWLG